jgi:putative protein kinase ArgK-like GTPase of G3E family
MENFEEFFEKLTAKQKKLPKGLRDAIEKKQGKEEDKGNEKDKKEDPIRKWTSKIVKDEKEKEEKKEEEKKNEKIEIGNFEEYIKETQDTWSCPNGLQNILIDLDRRLKKLGV